MGKRKWNGVPPRYWRCYRDLSDDDFKKAMDKYKRENPLPDRHIFCSNYPNCDLLGCGIQDINDMPGYR